ncbi:hypothetical protein [Halanaerobium salsuginis]|uniref:Uncharacterized protein n=1 Tax=Halanaerobium salsuginis TaxID=29563 RepID=A0A1I4L8F1_9FIRM|nr:hypothetical protein [Halanaerobium salsuginis]SFL87274.1 hypothetical protein SAMN02983006_02252 [Halanaerobium salsuginis]
MDYLFIGVLVIASVFYIGKKVYGGLKGTDSPCPGCSDKNCPVSSGKTFDFDFDSDEK